MKKALFIIVALSAVAISCTKSEVVKAPGRGREIKFDTYVGKTPMTKAESADLAYVQRDRAREGGFQVYAFLHNYITPTPVTPPAGEEVYNGPDEYVDPTSVGVSSAYMDKVVTWKAPVAADPDNGIEEVAGYWDYDGVVYWPEASSSRKLAFAAFGLNVKDNIEWAQDNNVEENAKTGHPEGQSYTKFTYTVPAAVADQKDLLVAPFLPNQGLKENQDAAPVKILFKHLLSRVGFQLVANKGGVEVIIKEIKLVGKFPKAGKVDLKGEGVITPITEGGDDIFATEYSFFPGDECFFTESTTVPVDIFANCTLVTSEDETNGETITEPVEIENPNIDNRYMMIMPYQQEKHMVYEDEENKTPALDSEGNVIYEENYKLPGAYIEVHYELEDADPAVARVSLDNWLFSAGKSYNFILKVSTYSIEFDVEVDSWNDHFAPVTGDNKPGNANGYYTLTPIVVGEE